MSKKKGCREPNPKAPESMSENNPRYLVSKDPSWPESNANYVTSNLAKNFYQKITFRQKETEVIIMFLQGLERVNNDQHKSTQKAVAKLQGDISKLLEIKEDEKIAKREAGR